jgi:hypothetical protein
MLLQPHLSKIEMPKKVFYLTRFVETESGKEVRERTVGG